MELELGSESDINNEKITRSNCSDMIPPNKKFKTSFDGEYICYLDHVKTEPDIPISAAETARPTTHGVPQLPKPLDESLQTSQKTVAEVPTSDTELPTSDTDLPTSNDLTAASPQYTEELVFQPAFESPRGAPDVAQSSNPSDGEVNIPHLQESSNADSTSENSVVESFDDLAGLDTKRTRRNSKRKKDIDQCCPVCGLTVRLPELESHFAQEVEKLANLPRRFKKTSRDDNGISTTYVRVKSNRENRLTAKVAQYAAKAKKEIQCPICKVRMSGSVEEINNHVVLCLQNDDHINVDDDDDEDSYEEYEIGNETRIRAISLIPGGYRSLQGQSVNRTHEDVDHDVDVEVDVDDTLAYGQPQYTELDVIPNNTFGLDEAHEQLRKSVLIDPTAQPQVLESRKWCENADENKSEVMEGSSNLVDSKVAEDDDFAAKEKKNSLSDHIVSSLKEKIKELEDPNNSDVKCLICMESYTKPVVSITCWHVHCEECWLMTMGVKKLCPQCNMIVFPSDLRKIYL